MSWSWPWPPERIVRLRTLWPDQGFSCSMIGRILGVSKNAVIGKAHRLGLPRRDQLECYLRYRGEAAVKSPKNVRKEPAPAIADPAPSERIATINLTDTTCKWPLGNPGEKDFGFCGRKVKEGHPYCEAHCLRAYQKERAA